MMGWKDRLFAQHLAVAFCIVSFCLALGFCLRAAAPSSPAPTAPAASAKVRVSDGNEIRTIDKADLGDALADGYKVVR